MSTKVSCWENPWLDPYNPDNGGETMSVVSNFWSKPHKSCEMTLTYYSSINYLVNAILICSQCSNSQSMIQCLHCVRIIYKVSNCQLHLLSTHKSALHHINLHYNYCRDHKNTSHYSFIIRSSYIHKEHSLNIIQ